jgi:hypothetical protein
MPGTDHDMGHSHLSCTGLFSASAGIDVVVVFVGME